MVVSCRPARHVAPVCSVALSCRPDVRRSVCHPIKFGVWSSLTECAVIVPVSLSLSRSLPTSLLPRLSTGWRTLSSDQTGVSYPPTYVALLFSCLIFECFTSSHHVYCYSIAIDNDTRDVLYNLDVLFIDIFSPYS